MQGGEGGRFAQAVDFHPDGSAMPRSSVWAPAASPLAVAVASKPAPSGVMILALGTRSGNSATNNFSLGGARGINIHHLVTATPGAGNLAVSLFGFNPALSNSFLISSGIAVTATGLHVHQFYPGASQPGVNAVELRWATALAGLMTCLVTHSAGGNWTYSVEIELLP